MASQSYAENANAFTLYAGPHPPRHSRWTPPVETPLRQVALAKTVRGTEAIKHEGVFGFHVDHAVEGPGAEVRRACTRDNFTDFTSRSGARNSREKFKPGLWLSMPSMSCNERTGEVLLKPRVLTILNPSEAEVKSLPSVAQPLVKAAGWRLFDGQRIHGFHRHGACFCF